MAEGKKIALANWAMAAICILMVITGACSTVNYYLGLKDDNIIEEMGEKFLKAKTGIDRDFTEESPEK